MKTLVINIRNLIIPAIDFFYPPFSKIMDRQTFRYVACGGGNTLFDIILFTVTNNYILQVNIVNMHWETSIYGDSFIYKMPMHRKKVRLRCYYFCVLFFSLLGFNLTIILIGLRAPWDPGIIHEPRKRGTSKFKLPHELHLQ
jgi:hypothetical protein